MNQMSDNLKLTNFSERFGPEIVSWVQSESEARAWCGHKRDQVKTAEIFHAWHGDNDVHPYILNEAAKPVGYGEIWVDPVEKEVELARIIIKPQCRGKGIGRRLVNNLVQKAEGYGFPHAFVRVVPENIAAIRCYERAGFIRVSMEESKLFNRAQPVEYVWLKRQLTRASADRA